MDLVHFTANGTLGLMPGTYKIVAIGPGGDGANGNKATGDNGAQYGTVDGADGAGGGAGAYIYMETFSLEAIATVGITITAQETSIIIADFMNSSQILKSISLPKAESANGVIPGNSLAAENYHGTSGGGAGGLMGKRGTTVIPVKTDGGKGEFYNGADSIPGTLHTVNSYTAAKGGVGGNNPASEIREGGRGGIGAQENGLDITADNFASVTLSDIAAKINGGNGTDGTAPASRPAATGIAGSAGAGGGGAWTSGADGTAASGTGAGVNGNGGIGGVGGVGCIWIKDIVLQQLKKKQRIR